MRATWDLLDRPKDLKQTLWAGRDLADKYLLDIPGGLLIEIDRRVASQLDLPTRIDIMHGKFIKDPLNAWALQEDKKRKLLKTVTDTAKKFVIERVFGGDNPTFKELFDEFTEVCEYKYYEVVKNKGLIIGKADANITVAAWKDIAGNTVLVKGFKYKEKALNNRAFIMDYMLREVLCIPPDAVEFNRFSEKMFYFIGPHKPYYSPGENKYYVKVKKGTVLVTVTGRTHVFKRDTMLELEPVDSAFYYIMELLVL
ncbi:hypothetical protein [Pyrococcus kukulkanii]|uniref:hypothetical protein n=1 Tax=Pyrococcus kukulkanii TaxID=1609559 RepID=UPI003565FC23